MVNYKEKIEYSLQLFGTLMCLMNEKSLRPYGWLMIKVIIRKLRQAHFSC